MKTHQCLIGLCFLLSSSVFGHLDYKHYFERISSDLTEATNSDDIKENLTVAQNLLKGEKKVSLGNLVKGRDKNLVHVLELLVMLNKIVEENSDCTEEALILKTIDQCLGGQVCRARSDIPEDRVESIVYRLALEHSRRCRNVYTTQLREIDTKIGKSDASSLKQLAELSLKTYYRKPLDKNDLRRLDYSSLETDFEKMFKGHPALEFFINLVHVKWLAENLEEDRSFEGRRNLILGAIRRSKDACRLTKSMYHPIIRSLMFDQQVLPLRPLTEFPDEDEAQLRLAIVKYKICDEYMTSYLGLTRMVPQIVNGLK